MAQNFASSPHFWDQFCDQSRYDIMAMIRAGVPVNQVRERMLAIEDDVINHMDSITAARRMRQCLQTCLQLQRMVNSYAQSTYLDSPGQVRSPSRSPHSSSHSLPTTPVRSPRSPGFHSLPSTPIRARQRNTLGSLQLSQLRFSSNASTPSSLRSSGQGSPFSGLRLELLSHTPSSASSQHSQEDYDEDVDEDIDEDMEAEELMFEDEDGEIDGDELMDDDQEDDEDEEDEEDEDQGELQFAIANPYEGQMGLAATPPLPLVDQTVDLFFLIPINEQDFQQQQVQIIEEVIHEEENHIREMVPEGTEVVDENDFMLNNLFQPGD